MEGPIAQITRNEVVLAIRKMKSGKVAGCSGFKVNLVKLLKEPGTDMVFDLLELVKGKKVKQQPSTSRKKTTLTVAAIEESILLNTS